MLNGFSSHVANASEELSGTPKVSFVKIFILPQRWMFFEELISTSALEYLQSFADWHRGRALNKQMHMIRHYLQLIHFKTPLLCNGQQDCFTILPQVFKLENRKSIFGLPNQMVSILTYTVPKIVQTFHFRCLRATKNFIAHANMVRNGACADFVAHHLL